MGYTHYIKTKKEFTDEKWKSFVKEVTLIITFAKLEGVPIESFVAHESFNPANEFISFEYDDSCESCVIFRKPNRFTFCKTNRESYDVAVVATYLLVKHYLGNGCSISSDGNTGPGPGPNVIANDFAAGEDLVFRALGKKLTWPKD